MTAEQSLSLPDCGWQSTDILHELEDPRRGRRLLSPKSSCTRRRRTPHRPAQTWLASWKRASRKLNDLLL